eukprot:365942-Chlamydomonas_euryale.AAC.33
MGMPLENSKSALTGGLVQSRARVHVFAPLYLRMRECGLCSNQKDTLALQTPPFASDGKGMESKTFSMKGNPPLPMHMESGYVRVIALPGSSAARIEFIVSAPNGVTTTEEGTIEGHIINLKLTSTTRSSTSRPPVTTMLERTYT